ncbi:hypothetical protein [uncultured Tateyamaria sp.]|uniref:hypothetical protein n=1 Tax=Tateyamaria sp. 1078 TaxID=3417464 RepID=UPI00261876AB|nr:hypothetical protein [uncultured Tateyamaria sp.]
MLNRSLIPALCLSAVLGQMVHAQDAAPLSAIDWLGAQTTPAALPQPTATDEPSTAQSATVPDVTVTPLDGPAARRVGLVPPNVTGLPDTLWSGSTGQTLAAQLNQLPNLRLPALQQLTFTLLLAEAVPPTSDAGAFDLARIDTLLAYGALDPAIALMEQAGADASPAHFRRAMDMALIAGREAQACAILRAQPDLSPGKGHDVFCAARNGDWRMAALQLGTARALELLPEAQVAALERFLDPDLYEGEPPLPVPSVPNALLFRTHAAIGEPIPTRGWPVVYANAGLSDTAGWKTQIEAAERLARNGAVPGNRLLGLYTQRSPAASGGVWDRVSALQRFETAIGTGNAAAISKTLPTVWRVMGAQRLRVPFAQLFAEQLEGFVLSGQAADIAYELLLLSPRYEAAAQVFPTRALGRPVLAALAAGEVPAGLTADGVAGAALAGFRDTPADADILAQARDGALGAAMLDTIALAHQGSTGDAAQLATALATLRALGLEDVARRTALQTLLLDAR